MTPEKGDSAPRNEPQYAGLGRRCVALVIDFFLLSLLFFPVTKLAKGVWIMGRSDHLWGYGWLVTDPLCILFLIVIVLYFVLMEGFSGFTLGKKLVSIQVVDSNGHRPGFLKALIRNLLRLVDALPALNMLGVVLILTSPQRARFGDRVAGTRVVISRLPGRDQLQP